MSGMGTHTPYSIERFRQANGPVVDVRSPAEFNKGHWPGAINLALFSDEQRAAVGITYKKKGRQQAIKLGLEFTGPKLSGLAEALAKLSRDPTPESEEASASDLRIYCWRGGMRSASVAWLAGLLDLKPVLLEGGYKSYRRWVLQQFEQTWPLRLLGGRTGTGKTDLLIAMAQRGVAVVNLEGLANHRGSSFGGLGLPPQPSTEHYENLLAEDLQRCQNSSADEIWLEAESSQVGRCRIPRALFHQMQMAPVLEINRSLDERVAQLVDVYGQHGRESLQEATQRISRRLGPQRTRQALDAIALENWDQACRAMLDYYDRCYDYELSRTPQRQSVDLCGLNTTKAAEMLIERELVRSSPKPQLVMSST
ncbi:tRNA 2-selenouridine(34) synthase MnmH [Prochlorococcus sp. MIT 1306]|uniref:tRNA 2-selenouridine(34) synthase MnmH n=1 Tax=Prochlorococcus sp. MIT 1306 TaxID=1799667 RepID=UPI0007B36728|nr:tRNA 2-selenouridine(34) synthase MnmH [Prochlorococcus sp. MIT 1306]KZR64077.1 tRNA 2-selenouridine synthase [Prochlorococcus sp. MIT 1306]